MVNSVNNLNVLNATGVTLVLMNFNEILKLLLLWPSNESISVSTTCVHVKDLYIGLFHRDPTNKNGKCKIRGIFVNTLIQILPNFTC